MKRNTLNKLLIIGCLLVIFSCKARKHIIASQPAAIVPAAPDNTIKNKLMEIRTAQLNFNTFSAKANTTLNINGNSNNVTLNIRINRDKEIWISISALFGIEVARAVITPDSILVLNRLQSLYIKKPFNYIYTYASKQVNYKTLESLLVGNAVPELLNDHASFLAADGNITLSGNLEDLIYKLMIGPDMKVARLNLSNQAQGQALQVTNNAFIQAANRIVPSEIDIASTIKDKTLQVNLHYTKVDFDQQLEYPFNIPVRYAPAN
jgi:hypothetical protein